MMSEIDYVTRVQQLGAYPLAFNQHFRNPDYVKPIDLFPLIPPINEIEQARKTEEDLEKWKQEFFRRIEDMVSLYAHREPSNKITLPPKTTFKTKTLGDLIEVLI